MNNDEFTFNLTQSKLRSILTAVSSQQAHNRPKLVVPFCQWVKVAHASTVTQWLPFDYLPTIKICFWQNMTLEIMANYHWFICHKIFNFHLQNTLNIYCGSYILFSITNVQ